MIVEELEADAPVGEPLAHDEPGGARAGARMPQADAASPCSNANAVAPARLATPSFARMLLTCRATVRSLRNRWSAISRFDRPLAIRRITSTSRRVRPPAASDRAPG